MNIFILNQSLQKIQYIENYESFIWTERYSDIGDFELHMRTDDRYIAEIVKKNYIQIPISNNLMFIENIISSFDVETGYFTTVKGRSLESILKRRVIYPQRVFNNVNVQTLIQTLLNDYIIVSASVPHRRIPNFTFKATTNPNIAQMSVSRQYLGESLYDAIKGICDTCSIGFRINLTEAGNFEFELYDGYDRTFDQQVNPCVIFSPTYNNLISSEYESSDIDFSNTAVVAGEGDGLAKDIVVVEVTEGLDRREVYIDASNIKSTYDDANNTPIPTDLYTQVLAAAGKEELAKIISYTNFTAEVDNMVNYKYGSDYYVGDKVQVVDDIGHGAAARIIEVVVNITKEGFRVYPQFQIIEDNTYKN